MTTPAQPPSARNSLSELSQAAVNCRACPLWKNATQVVFGKGPQDARVMLVGEQPGDQEDRRGEPFVGPAGQLLRRILKEIGLAPESVYLTNAVKHFKWTLQGARRLHKAPALREIAACYPWLQAEIRTVRPQVLVCLGATAAKALIDRDFKLTSERGRFIESSHAPFVMATFHPSYLLRIPDETTRLAVHQQLVADLKMIHEALENDPG